MVAAMPQSVAAPSLAAKPPVNDPDFDINIAMNTFSKQLGERVRSGQMTVADAQRAQAQMRALQVNPATANRAAATEIAQRALQVGPYHPSNIAAQQAAQQPATSAVSNYIANMNAPSVTMPVEPPRQVVAPPPAVTPPLPEIVTSSPPLPEIVTSSPPLTPPASNPVSDYIANMNAPSTYDAAAAYRNNSQGLLDALNAGQINVGYANQLKAPMFEATKLGNTAEGQAAMQAAATQAQGGMPIAGYDPAAQYRSFGNDLMALINSGAITPQQANAIKAPVFEAVRLGNTNQGYNQMQAALAAGRQQMGQYTMPVQPMPQPPMPQPPGPQPQPPMPQGQPTPGQPTPGQPTPGQPTPGQPMPQAAPVPGMYRGGFAVRR